MIFITVKSEIMDCKKQFETDLKAERYLKRVKRIHDLSRWQRLDYFPRYFDESTIPKHKHRWAVMARLKGQFDESIRYLIPLKIEILNTDAAQLNLINELTK